MKQFDDFAAVCIEIQFQKYVRSSKSLDYRYVNMSPYITIDLQSCIVFRNDNPGKMQRKIKRSKNYSRVRQDDSERFMSPCNFLMKNKKGVDYGKYDYAWLAQ